MRLEPDEGATSAPRPAHQGLLLVCLQYQPPRACPEPRPRVVPLECPLYVNPIASETVHLEVFQRHAGLSEACLGLCEARLGLLSQGSIGLCPFQQTEFAPCLIQNCKYPS